MPHQDSGNCRTNLQALKDIFEMLLPLELNHFARHGNAKLSPAQLAAMAIACWGWTWQGTLSDRIHMAGSALKRVFRNHKTTTRQGLMQALASCGDRLLKLTVQHIADKLAKLKGYWSRYGAVNFVIDATKFKAPRTQANQDYFSAIATKPSQKKYHTKADRSKAATVQVQTTVAWHLGTGLPYRWHLGGSGASERKSLVAMLADFPPNARLIGDAQYIGYPLWSAIIHSHKNFLVRVGANVKLLKNLGALRIRDGYVYYWPDEVARREQPPLVLRLIKIHTGKATIYLVSNELDLTDHQAGELYRARWGVEIFFRTVKQSCQRSKLCCGTPKNVLTELNWTLLGIWAALFHGKQVLQECGESLHRLSPIKVIRAFAATILAVSIRAQAEQPLLKQLATALKADESQRTTSKQSNNYPRKREPDICSKPKIINASTIQKQQAKKHSI